MAIKREFIIERQGKQVVIYAGLLDELHQQAPDGPLDVKTRLIQIGADDNEKTWVVHASVTTPKGTFEGIGDANPANVSRAMLTCLPRMAETRAKARAMRDAINCSSLLLADDPDEDLPDFHEQQHTNHAATRPATAVPASPPVPPATGPRPDDGLETRLFPPTPAKLEPNTTAMREDLAQAWGEYRPVLQAMRDAGYKVPSISDDAPIEQLRKVTKNLSERLTEHRRTAKPLPARSS